MSSAKSRVKVFVVNLKRQHKRRKFIESQLKGLGLDYCIVDAVDASAIPANEIEQANQNRTWKLPMRPGEVACSMSHILALDLLASDASCDYGLIIEDDVLLGKDLTSVVDALVQSDLSARSIALCACIVSKPTTFTPGSALSEDFRLVTPESLERIFGTQAYFLSSELAGSLRHDLAPVRTVADDWHAFVQRGWIEDINVVYPLPVVHAELLSDIHFDKQLGDQSLRSNLKRFIYQNEVYPFYSLFLSWRRRRAEKVQRRNISVPALDLKRTYRLS